MVEKLVAAVRKKVAPVEKLVKSNSDTLPSMYRKAEVKKKKCYEQGIREVEHCSFTPLVFLATFYKRLASIIIEKKKKLLRIVKCLRDYDVV